MSGYVNWNATADTRIYMNFYGSYAYMEDGRGLKNDGWSLFAYGGIQQSLPRDWHIKYEHVRTNSVDNASRQGKQFLRLQFER